MLALAGFAMILTFMVLIMTNRLSAMTALLLVPVAFAMLTGFGPQMGPMMLDGIKNIAPTGIMLVFAILYFGLMTDAGLFDPVISRIQRVAHGDPMKIIMGTALLALLVSLDGDGATTYIIVVTAMLPLYRQLGINPLILTCMNMLVGGVMNILPWGGPTARAMSVLHLDSTQLFNPLIPAMGAGLVWVFFVAWHFGKRERKRLGLEHLNKEKTAQAAVYGLAAGLLRPLPDGPNLELSAEEKDLRRPPLAMAECPTHHHPNGSAGARAAATAGVVYAGLRAGSRAQLPQPSTAAAALCGPRWQRVVSGGDGICGGHFYRHPQRHAHGGRYGPDVCAVGAAGLGTALSGAHGTGKRAAHVLHVERRVLLWHPAVFHKGGGAV